MSAIPNNVPDELAELIYRNWGDMKSFSEACGLKYTMVHSVLCRSNHTAIEKIERIADALGVTVEEIADVVERADKAEFTKMVQESEFKTYTNLAAHIQVSSVYLHGLFSGLIKNSHLHNVRLVSGALGISLSKFRQLYQFLKAS